MNKQPKLSEAEGALVIDSLAREHHDGPVELHHTRPASDRRSREFTGVDVREATAELEYHDHGLA
jgi:hypothetical protein